MNQLCSLFKAGVLRRVPRSVLTIYALTRCILIAILVFMLAPALAQVDVLDKTGTEKTEVTVKKHLVERQRNPDDACTQCHKVEKEGMHGVHASVKNPNNGLPITCTNCHGNISLEHRNGAADVMNFSKSEVVFRADQQNSVCMSCHEPEALRTAFWQHDVHFMKLSCASCHQLHREKDPMQGLDKKSQVKLCVDCHSEQHKQKGMP